MIFNISTLSVICFVIGFLLMIIEMFHPGFGFPGAIGGILLIVGVVFSARTVVQALIMLIIILAVLGITLTVVLKSFSKGRLSKTLVLEDIQKKERGYICVEDLNFFLNKEGLTTTVLRPSGTADFNGIRLDVISEGGFIQKEKKVKIIHVEGRRIVVKEII
ncbi:NfeD family protein [Clostridium sp. MB40-C1]|uniref:NfeD family protein n=1 Tax=Clostridium sp. MB40-C1 TaxID=3070996 RepID=UPI0027E1033B|nr:NfeD family protein [Clostridium sp. MB40-C1]WMJ79304.1 NfeD family protein [Clostridium sp. MB40-C1]